MEEHKVYHIRNIGDSELTRGYVGVTNDIRFRMYGHKKTGMLTAGREFVVLHTGDMGSCLALEASLRPVPGIGWNTMEGGWNKIQPGYHLSKETQIKPNQRLSPATEFISGQVPHNFNTGKHYLVTDPFGETYYVESLCKFAEAHNLTPQNLRKVAKGQRAAHKGWTAKEVSV